MREFPYDLADDNGVSTIELPFLMRAGSVFCCEYGTYEVTPPHEQPEGCNRILCERINKITTDQINGHDLNEPFK